MIDVEIPTLTEYNTSRVKRLADELLTLRTFAAIAQWDLDAQGEAANIQKTLGAVRAKMDQLMEAVQAAEAAYKSKSFFARLFYSREPERKLRAELARVTQERDALVTLSDQLETTIDFSPNSPEDLKELIEELKLRKKELRAERKAATSAMTAIRAEARQEAAFLERGDTWQRRLIRLQKEAGLMPHETQKAAIDRQLVRIDRILAWLDRVKASM